MVGASWRVGVAGLRTRQATRLAGKDEFLLSLAVIYGARVPSAAATKSRAKLRCYQGPEAILATST